MGYLFGQKRRKVSRLQRQAARCFLVTQEASSVELGTWCWPRVVLIEKRPLTECERSSMKRAARSVGACQSRQRPSAAFCRASSLGVQPRSEAGWIVSESPRLVCPSFADVLVGSEPAQGLEALSEVVGVEEGFEVLSEVVRFGEAVLDTMLAADAVEHVQPVAGRRAGTP